MSEQNLPSKKKMPLWQKIGIGVLIFIGVGQLGKGCENNEGVKVEANAAASESILSASAKPDSTLSVEPAKLTGPEIDKMLSGLKSKKDDFKETTFYNDPSNSKFVDNNQIYLYLGRNGNYVYPRLRIQYAGDDWVFVNLYRFVIDGQNRSILPEEDMVRDNEGGTVWEYVDKNPSMTDLLILKEIAESKSAKMRYEGKDKVFDRVISSKEKQSLRRIIKIIENTKDRTEI